MLKVKLLDEKAKAPTVAHPGEDLAYDLYALEDATLYSYPTWVRTGIAVEDTDGCGFVIKDRSSVAGKGIFTHGGVIDPGYRGEIKINMTTTPSVYVTVAFVKAGDKVAQMIPTLPQTNSIEVVGELSDSSRGDRGFGSSGV